jgi:hypothetical protein
MMKRLAVLLLLAFATNVMVAQSGREADTDKKLVEKEKQLWQGWQDKKAAPFREMLTKDTVAVNPTGIQRGVETTAAEIEKGDCEVKSWEVHEPKVDWIDKNTALITYHAVQDATCGGQKIPDAVWASSIWVKQKDKWMNAFHQETPDMSKMAPKP